MSTRRKYRAQPPAYRDGGAVIDNGAVLDKIDNVIIDEPAPLPQESAAAPLPDDGDALVRAYHAQARAEDIQRTAAQQPRTVEEHIDRLALSDHKKRFLKQHPSLAVDPGEARAMSFAYHQALNAGVQDDTEEMDRRIIDGMRREREHAVKTLVKAPPADPRPAPAAQVPRKSSVPFVAPVSREVPTMSGNRQMSDHNTLSPQEVEIARNSFTDPGMSNARKEYLYLQNRNRYRKMKASGEYSDQGGG